MHLIINEFDAPKFKKQFFELLERQYDWNEVSFFHGNLFSVHESHEWKMKEDWDLGIGCHGVTWDFLAEVNKAKALQKQSESDTRQISSKASMHNLKAMKKNILNSIQIYLAAYNND